MYGASHTRTVHSQISTPGRDIREDGHATADTPGTGQRTHRQRTRTHPNTVHTRTSEDRQLTRWNLSAATADTLHERKASKLTVTLSLHRHRLKPARTNTFGPKPSIRAPPTHSSFTSPLARSRAPSSHASITRAACTRHGTRTRQAVSRQDTPGVKTSKARRRPTTCLRGTRLTPCRTCARRSIRPRPG